MNMEQDDDDTMVVEYGERKSRIFVSARQFYRYMFMMRGSIQIPHWIWSMFKLAEYFIADVENRIERNELEHSKKNQEDLRGLLGQDLINALAGRLEPGEKLGKVHFVPKTVKGSRRYMQAKYADALTMVRKFGNPTL